jgi:hypothetical protein
VSNKTMKTHEPLINVDRSLIQVGAKRLSSLVQTITHLERVNKEKFRNTNCRFLYSGVIIEVNFLNNEKKRCQQTDVSSLNSVHPVLCYK